MKFRKRPVVIEAEQFWPDKPPWPTGVYRVGGSLPNDTPDLWWRIKTLEGEYIVKPGDWIITGVAGERYPCKPDIFAQTYEPVEESK